MLRLRLFVHTGKEVFAEFTFRAKFDVSFTKYVIPCPADWHRRSAMPVVSELAICLLYKKQLLALSFHPVKSKKYCHDISVHPRLRQQLCLHYDPEARLLIDNRFQYAIDPATDLMQQAWTLVSIRYWTVEQFLENVVRLSKTSTCPWYLRYGRH